MTGSGISGGNSGGGAVRQGLALGFQGFGNKKCHLKALAGVQAGVALGLIPGAKAFVRNGDGTARTFRDVLTSHLQMDATGMGIFRAVNREESGHFSQNSVERTGLQAPCGLDRIAVHGVTAPQNMVTFSLHGANQAGQMRLNLVMAESGDEGDSARLVPRIQRIEQADQLIRLQTRPAFQAQRVAYAAQELHMRTAAGP